MDELIQKASNCRLASKFLRHTTVQERNGVLTELAKLLRKNLDQIIKSNSEDVERGRDSGLSMAILDRLTLTPKRVQDIASAVDELVLLDDPIGVELDRWTRPNGIEIQKVRVPIGVIGMIYEARPNVTIDSASISLKSGNCALLRGSRSTLSSNVLLTSLIQDSLLTCGFPAGCVELLLDGSQETARRMMELHSFIDVLIPRGGSRLIQEVRKNARIPVLETGEGNCHLYIHSSALKDMAINIAVNAKASRPSVCNSIETILIDHSWARENLASLVEALNSAGVECRGCVWSRDIVASLFEASEDDFATEYLDYKVAIKVVSGLEEALEHIERFSTLHSEAIVAEDLEIVEKFLKLVDAAAVYHNASTRFTDGGEFGFGAEIGISTQKLHARGPMGLSELCSYTYRVRGSGQIR
jgi:glutamate-5-semialdehyde dehydrogenase